jgi:serine/threonine-protein kinase HipA
MSKICPITYEAISSAERYSEKGLKLLSPKLKALGEFPYSAKEQRIEAEARSSKLSIQGVQPKLSAALNIKDETFEVVDRGGRYILKPQVERYAQVPENEDVSMRMAALAGIEVPVHGLIYSKDQSFTYFIKRFDRKGQKDKLHVEDFAQLSDHSRDTKYDSSMEQVAEVIERFCTFPAIEKVSLFKRTLFSYLIGNEDMHLKNFSIILQDGKVTLSPAYDFLNSTIVLVNPKEEFALPIQGKKNKITKNDLTHYFAKEKLAISNVMVQEVLDHYASLLPEWNALIQKSFLSDELKTNYMKVLNQRSKVLGFL